ncbi:MAG TPA: UPF0158 family protein [Acetobacteraceae bacterium]|nr:UPF0158 family protein [Acetobacteraceae bacterium]
MTRANPTLVKAAELRDAYDFVSVGLAYGNRAYISRETGKIYWVGDAIEPDEEVPGDLDAPDRYIAVPDRYSLDLGNALVFSFVDQELPDDYDTIRGFFRRKGAYARFKDLLDARGMLQKWYDFEDRETDQALAEWSEENGVQLTDD